ncbi:DUF899 family protein [Virgibacillus necropolis]|uniref:DUF899 family protein n=1 Tax=Virgibacillus necropolis TaxID=163877 RepID=UPI00384ADF89
MSEQAVADKIYALEQEISKKKEELAVLRRDEEKLVITDYELRDKNGKKIALSELFRDSDTLFVIQNMGSSCSYCTLWAYEINGILHHLESIAPVILASSDEPETMRDFAEGRNWNFNLVSTAGAEFKKTLGFEPKQASPHPGVSILKKKDDGTIFQYTKASFGPGDDFCGMWSFVRMLPEEQTNWHPKKNY